MRKALTGIAHWIGPCTEQIRVELSYSDDSERSPALPRGQSPTLRPKARTRVALLWKEAPGCCSQRRPRFSRRVGVSHATASCCRYRFQGLRFGKELRSIKRLSRRPSSKSLQYLSLLPSRPCRVNSLLTTHCTQDTFWRRWPRKVIAPTT